MSCIVLWFGSKELLTAASCMRRQSNSRQGKWLSKGPDWMACRAGSSGRGRHPSTRRLFQLGSILPGQQDAAAPGLLKNISWQACQKASLTLELSPYIFCLVTSALSHRTSSGLNTCGLAPHAYFERNSVQWHAQKTHVQNLTVFRALPLSLFLFLRNVSEW